MSRIDALKTHIDDLYNARQPRPDEWAGWLHANHIYVVADYAKALARRFGANEELAVAAGMLHDIADAVMHRFDERHEEESIKIAKRLLGASGFSDEDIELIAEDAIRYHGCHGGKIPRSLEGKVMAAADALAHLKTDFYAYGVSAMRQAKTVEEIRQWALPKIERDFRAKIFDEDVRAETAQDYERAKRFIEYLT